MNTKEAIDMNWPVAIKPMSNADIIKFTDRIGPMKDKYTCWIWQGTGYNREYGMFAMQGRNVFAHRVSHHLFNGEIPEKFTVDHICRVKQCMNPYHLEAVTFGENSRRSPSGYIAGKKAREKTHCRKGHEFNEENTGWANNPTCYSGKQRYCKPCKYTRIRNKKELSHVL